ncbi:unnamed protein product [Lactuca saligna]|uniref:Uncharacterized protein n=1 Tax=Lactuca saligna TaxID=75948 RepID=A0AA36EBM0_LACSI|nr:unnamed protein product [Lactuca saligna]
MIGIIQKTKNEELCEARWELFDGLKSYPIGGDIGTKRSMGLVDSNPFFVGSTSSVKKENATKLVSHCKQLVEDPNWYDREESVSPTWEGFDGRAMELQGE